MPCDLGSKAQRKDISPSVQRRRRLLPVVPSSFQLPATQPARLCSVLPGIAGTGECLGSKHEAKAFKGFRKEVNKTRDWIQKQDKKNMFSENVSNSLCVAQKILEETFVPPTWSEPRKPCILLEIYTNPNSSLTNAFQKAGYFALRFTKQDGDLNTVEGRKKLWSWIDRFQPLNIWASPECGPWSGWNHLNQFKSVALFDRIQKLRNQEKQHVSLCAQICEFQCQRKRHFHLEQPLGSSMIQLVEFQPISRNTKRAKFDMCVFGLKHPMSKKSLRKSSQVFTTDDKLYMTLSKAKCDHLHEHQPIEGSVIVDNRRMPLTAFCASYCSGFARHVAKCIVKNTLDQEIHIGEHEDMPPAKRCWFSFDLHKRFKASHPIDLETEASISDAVLEPSTETTSNPLHESKTDQETGHAPNVSAADACSKAPSAEVPNRPGPSRSNEDLWKPIFQELDRLAPRVGNLRIDNQLPIVKQIQEMIPKMLIHASFVCRGTERCQIPVGIPEPSMNNQRHTICLHRTTGEIHDLGMEEWTKLKRSQRIRPAVPSKLMITLFGQCVSDMPAKLSAIVPAAQPEAASDVPVKPAPWQPNPTQSQCEGWAPPPVALHGPNYRKLTSQEKADLRKLHINLGHPAPKTLAEHLKAQNAEPHIVDAARDFSCETCVESTGQRAHRPAKLHEPRDFNDCVGMDGFYWSGIRGFQVHVFHCLDEASLFHLGKRCETRNPDEVIESWSEFWTSWAGDPAQLYTDPAGEFISQEWKDHLMSRSIQPLISTEAWQRGRIERHGQIIKRMLSRFDLDKPIENTYQFDQALRACFQAKNSLVRHQGYSPEQIVLGKATKLPSSLTSDESAVSHALADGDGPESEVFRKALEIRTLARKAFLLSDNDQAIRRALLRKSRPSPTPYATGQLVMFWIKRSNPNRSEAGRWCGPAKVIFQESPSSVWISYAERMFKRAPESLRPASIREWHMSNTDSAKWYQNLPDMDFEQKGTHEPIPFEYDPSIAPSSPNIPPNSLPATPNSTQPESEHFPEPNQNPESNESDAVSNPIPAIEAPTEPIDLDAETETVSDDTALHILTCHAINDVNDSEDLFEWTTAERGEETSEILLAEDGVPYHNQPLTCSEQQCFSLEIVVNQNDIQQWFQSEKPEEMAAIASASKRARAEVSVKNLNLEEKILFEKAKDAELNCWVQTNALKPILRKYLNPEQILKSRWVLTWKEVDPEQNHGSQKKAKARLVVLGFQDPHLTEVARDSPTLTREGRHTVLQTIASQAWELCSFDIKTAFLRGQADAANPLAMEPPPELRKKLDLHADQVCSLIGNAYGRVDAPLLFYKELTKQWKKLGFRTHPLEPCVFILESNEPNGQRRLHGILGTHVDDGIIGGDAYFREKISKLKEVLPFGSFKTKRFVFTGILLEQTPDGSIMASQEDYVKRIPAIDIGRIRRSEPTSPINESELNKLRGLIGSLQYAVTHTRPDLAAKLGEVQTQIANATVQTLLTANKVLREAQENSHVKICFRHIDPKLVTHVSFGDASFASAKQLSSFQGTIICATDLKLEKNQKAPVSPLTWTSKKIARVVS